MDINSNKETRKTINNILEEKNQSKILFGKGLSKLDIAEIQINSAIKMLFDDINPISIHTVISSGYQIVRDFSARYDDTQEYFEMTVFIKEDYIREFWKSVNKHNNFFKHADKDPDDIYEGFNDSINDYTILWAILLYKGLNRVITQEMKTFLSWFQVTDPRVLKKSPFREKLESAFIDFHVGQRSRKELLAIGKKVLRKESFPH